MAMLEQFTDIVTGRNRRRYGRNAPDDMDILDKLKAEHDAVKALLAKLVDSESGPERLSLARQVKAALVPHTRAEEKIVYDAIIALREKAPKIDGNEGYLEHQHADIALKKLLSIKPATSPEFSAAAKVLKELVEHHIDEEERNVWRDVRKAFDGAERMEMNRAFEAAKKRVRIQH
jgi:hypothetical protein